MNVLLRKMYGLVLLLAVIAINSCSTDNDIVMESVTKEITNQEEETETEEESNPEEEPIPDEMSCTNPLDFVFNEKEGLVLVEFENAEFSSDWKLETNGSSYSGAGYMVWEGPQHLSNPGNGTATFKIEIENPGTYQFIWFSAIKTGNSGTDHNDTWLRFNDADNYYAQNNQGTSTVYPKDTGKTPNPEGASKDGWFKIYRSGNDLDFKWQSSTFDNNAHNIFVDFNSPGFYIMEVSARSTGHGIDKFVLFNDAVSKADAISSTEFSTVTCN
jgi:hypothetical protein